ncbi:MAG: hypothetical protein WCI73_11665, partial [Phycisphaerae bacterium]
MWHPQIQTGSNDLHRCAAVIQRRRARYARAQGARYGAEMLETRVLLSAGLDFLDAPPVAIQLDAGGGGSSAYFDHVIFGNNGGLVPAGSSAPPATAFNPAQIKSAYGINLVTDGGVLQDGTGMTIAIIDAYDNPKFVSRNSSADVNLDTSFLASDLHQFDLMYNLPEPAGFFTKVNQTGGTAYPAGNSGWGTEIALDVEWVHAIAPGAKIVLVEANSATDADLLSAAGAWARDYSGAVAITMSFGRSESASNLDSVFHSPVGHGVVWLASTGDSGQPGGYPALAPNIVAVGGTTLVAPGGVYSSESGWSGSGGGISVYESQPAYQSGLVIHNGSTIISAGGKRTIPDVAFDADPASGVAVYDSYSQGTLTPWLQVGGTSFSSPAWAGLIAITDQIRANHGFGSLDGVNDLLPSLYNSSFTGDYHDITTGSNGYSAGVGYDLVTGLGSPKANTLLSKLAGLNLAVIGSNPAGRAVVTTPPTSFTITFSYAIDPASLQAGDLTVNGGAADGVSLSTDGLVATFTYASSPVTAQGLQTMTMAAGAVTKLGDPTTTLASFSSSFRYDALVLQVASTTPTAGAVLTLPGPFIYEVTFNEAVDPASVQMSDLTLSGLAGATVTGVSVLPGNTTARFTINGVAAE